MTKIIKIISVLPLLIFLLFSSISAEQPAPPVKYNHADSVIVYYFHGNYRCASCTKIEKYSRDAISNFFSKEIKAGFLSFQAVNTDLSENKHFLKDYQLYTKSLVLISVKEGKILKWKNLDKIWQRLNNKAAFYNYVQTETKKFLEEA